MSPQEIAILRSLLVEKIVHLKAMNINEEMQFVLRELMRKLK